MTDRDARIGDTSADEAAAAWLSAIVNSSDDAIVSKTLEGIITSWNRAAERMFGYTAAEAVGQHIMLIIPAERRPEEDEVLAQVRRGEVVDHFETVRIAKDGRRLDISLTVSPIRDSTGRIIGASKIARDVTDRKRAETERDELLGRERAARAEAEALNRSKDQFLAVLSHELRTPLSAIFGWARMLSSGTLDAAGVKRAVEAIVRNASAQVQLVEDLLDVSRIVTGNMRLDVRLVDLRAVVEAAIDTVHPAANAKDITLQRVLDSRAGAIMGDPARLQQVVWNLVMNAVKFTPRGGRVEVSLQRANSYVEISVSDTGEGISPELVPFIFDRFWQGDSTSTRSHGGLGIGLALVKHLVDLHGGTVSGHSGGKGKGATFTVRLPVALARSIPEPWPLPPSVEIEAAGAKPVLLRALRILVVDDDVDGLDLASTILINAGAEVRTAPSARAAREVLLTWQPDVLVSDIEMPGEDGYAVLRKTRAVYAARGARIPAVALTAYGRPEDRVRTLEAGFNLHLAKPVDPTELVIAVASVAGRLG